METKTEYRRIIKDFASQPCQQDKEHFLGQNGRCGTSFQRISRHETDKDIVGNEVKDRKEKGTEISIRKLNTNIFDFELNVDI